MPYRVSLISTDRDLRDLRSQIIRALKGTGFDVLAFEQADFPLRPGEHSHDVCLLNLDLADIVVLVIDKRAGGQHAVLDTTITRAEWQRALARRVPILPCISHDAHAHAHAAIEVSRSSGTKSTVGYFDSTKTVDFIQEVRTGKHDNYCIFFADSTDLWQKLEAKLAGLTPWVLQRLAEEQLERLGNLRTASPTDLALRELVDSGHFIAPPYRVLGTPRPQTQPLIDFVAQCVTDKQSLFLLGEPGLGKTSALYAAFSHVLNLHASGAPTPLYVNMAELPAGISSLAELLRALQTTYMRQGSYPLLRDDLCDVYFFVDGIDEAISTSQNASTEWASSPVFACPNAAACRSHEFHTSVASSSLTSKYRSILQLQPWTFDTEVQRYLRTLTDTGTAADTVSGLHQLLSDDTLRDLASNPLLLRMLSFVYTESGIATPSSRGALYDLFFSHWVTREGSRAGTYHRFASDCLAAWTAVAWRLYEDGHADYAPQRIAAELVDSSYPGLSHDGRFWVAFHVEPRGIRFRHHSFLEFLVARAVYGMLYADHATAARALSTHLTREIRHYLVDLITLAGDYPALVRVLANLVSTPDTGPGPNLQAQNQAVYLLGHLPTPAAAAALRSCATLPLHTFVRSSLYWALTRSGDWDALRQYLKALHDSESDPCGLDAMNRGYHLYYYREWGGNGTPPFIDDGSVLWDRTRSAIIENLNDGAAMRRTQRLLDAYTLVRFLESRPGSTISPETADIVATRVKEVTPGQAAWVSEFASSICNRLHRQVTDVKDS